MCTTDFMLGPLNGRWKASAAAELTEFYGKNSIFNEQPVYKQICPKFKSNQQNR